MLFVLGFAHRRWSHIAPPAVAETVFKTDMDRVLRTSLIESYLAARPDLVRFFTARLRSKEAAEDLVQDMYERVLRVPQDEPIGNPMAYLYRLGTNLLLDQARYDGRRMVRDAVWSELNRARLAGVDIVDEPGAERVADAKQRLDRLLAAAKTLPPRTQQAFQLHKLEGRSHAETALVMGVSRSAVEKHISTALKFLLSKL
jgi:RNA polymerase sigma-70 factor (ECF subfamily)